MSGVRIERVVEWIYFCVGAEEPAVAAYEEEDGEEGEEEEGEGCSGWGEGKRNTCTPI